MLSPRPPNGPVLLLSGEAMGRRYASALVPGGPEELVLRISGKQVPSGPPEGAMVVVDVGSSGDATARYISWIGYCDLDKAASEEVGRWEMIEPSEALSISARWIPFGGQPLAPVWRR